MSNPEEADTCLPDTQETYYDESFKVTSETQNTMNESQDFHLVDSEGDGDSRSKPPVVQIDDDGEKILDSSTEMIYDRQSAKMKPEVVQIDDSHEDGEKIVMDLLEKSSEIQVIDKSSYESTRSHESKSSIDFSYKESMKESSLDSKLTTEKILVNGSTESKKSDTDVTLSLDFDTFSVCDEQILPIAVITTAHDMKKIDSNKGNSFASKDMDNSELISISDNETSNVEEKNKSDLICNTLAKTVQVSDRYSSAFYHIKHE